MTVLATLALLVAVQAAAALLVISAHRHSRDRAGLVHLLGRHRVLPRAAVRPVSYALPTGCLAVGGAALLAPGVTALSAPGSWAQAQRLAAALVGAVYLVFLLYLGLLARRTPGAPCGCLGDADERTGVALIRAAVVCALAAVVVLPGTLTPLTTVPGWPSLPLLAAAVGGLAAAVAAAGAPRPIRPHLSGGRLR